MKKQDLDQIFNLSPSTLNKEPYEDIPYPTELSGFLSADDYHNLKKKLEQDKNINKTNIANRITAKQAVIRVRGESYEQFQRLYKVITEAGLPVSQAVFADFLLLKSIGKI